MRRHVWGEGASPSRQARRQLTKLTALRVVARHDQRVGGVRSGSEGYVYSIDVIGQMMTGASVNRRRPRPVGLPFIAHSLAVTDCYLAIQALAGSGTIEMVHFETEPGCWRDFSGPGGARLISNLTPSSSPLRVSMRTAGSWRSTARPRAQPVSPRRHMPTSTTSAPAENKPQTTSFHGCSGWCRMVLEQDNWLRRLASCRLRTGHCSKSQRATALPTPSSSGPAQSSRPSHDRHASASSPAR